MASPVCISPVDGVWEAWQEWGECSVTCGGGLRTRARLCDGPYHDGRQCPGNATDSEGCNPEICYSESFGTVTVV